MTLCFDSFSQNSALRAELQRERDLRQQAIGALAIVLMALSCHL
jgi:hypothetical protein